jgi:vacuolar-type H+-ATPase subunit E/Vma4
MRTHGSVASVIAAIQDEAAAHIERLEREAAAAIAGMTEPAPAPVPCAEEAPRVTAARGRARRDESDDEWSARLEDLDDRERWMLEIASAGRRALCGMGDRSGVRRWTRALVAEAAAHLPPGRCVVVVPAGAVDHLDDGWRDEAGRSLERELSIEAGAITAGCIVRLADRPIAYDNTLEARERRTQVEWRAALAQIYSRAVADVGEPGGAPVPAASPAGASS